MIEAPANNKKLLAKIKDIAEILELQKEIKREGSNENGWNSESLDESTQRHYFLAGGN